MSASPVDTAHAILTQELEAVFTRLQLTRSQLALGWEPTKEATQQLTIATGLAMMRFPHRMSDSEIATTVLAVYAQQRMGHACMMAIYHFSSYDNDYSQRCMDILHDTLYKHVVHPSQV